MFFSFLECEKKKKKELGGKGFNLVNLQKKGFNVPHGFICTTLAFRNWLIENKLSYSIKKAIQKLTKSYKENGKKASSATFLAPAKEVSEYILIEIEKTQKKIPEELVISFKAKLESSKQDNQRYSVRSSCTMEDMKNYSFAGQYETILNVPRNKILDGIVECWKSTFTVQSLIYLVKNEIIKYEEDVEKIKIPLMACVIQEMIFGDASGVCLTVHTLTESRDMITIESVFGLGKGIVDGKITPDSFRVRKKDFHIIEKRIGLKENIVVPCSNKKNQKEAIETKKLENEKSKICSLSDEVVKEIAKIATKIEEVYGLVPQDIEFTVKDNEVFILQSRDITFLFPAITFLDSKLPKNTEFNETEYKLMQVNRVKALNTVEVMYDFGHSQSMISAMHNLGISNVSKLVEGYVKKLLKGTENEYFHDCMIGNRYYMKITQMLNTFKTSGSVKTSSTVLNIVEYLLDENMYNLKVRQLSSFRFFLTYISIIVVPLLKKLGSFFPFFFVWILSFCKNLICCGICLKKKKKRSKKEPKKDFNTKLQEMSLKKIQNLIEQVDTKIHTLEKESTKKNMQLIKDKLILLEELNSDMVNSIIISIFGVFFAMMIAAFLKSTFLKNDKLFENRISGGISKKEKTGKKLVPINITTSMVMKLADLTEIIRKDQKIQLILNDITNSKTPISYSKFLEVYKEKIVDTPAGKQFIEEYALLNKNHGFRGFEEIDFCNLRFKEDIRMQLKTVLKNLRNEEGFHEKRFEESRTKSYQEIDVIVATIKDEFKKKHWLIHWCSNGLVVWIIEKVIFKALKMYRQCIAYREHPKWYMIRVYDKLKQEFLKIGSDLKDIGYISEKEDIFFLFHKEIEQIADSTNPKEMITKEYIKGLVKFRKDEYKVSQKHHPPAVIGTNMENFDTLYDLTHLKKESKETKKDTLYGDPTSSGIQIGTARIIKSVDDINDLKNGEILITNSTDPSWCSVFSLCSGIILGIGGSVSHGVLVARELSLPAISGCKDAMKSIPNGSLIKMNGNTGEINILKFPEDQ